jgi:PKD repeat protein
VGYRCLRPPPGGGTYTIYAVATPNARDDLADAVYGTASVTLRGEPGPTAGFTANTTAGPAPLAVRFTDASTGEITAWFWSFGDGNTST